MMRMHQNEATLTIDHEKNLCLCKGAWSILSINNLLTAIDNMPFPASQSVTISGEEITEFDSAGALALIQCQQQIRKKTPNVELVHFNQKQQALISLLEKNHQSIDYTPPPLSNTIRSMNWGKRPYLN